MIDFDLKIRKFPFNAQSQSLIDTWQKGSHEYGSNWPVVYVIHNDKTGEAYIGETLNAGIRATQHWQNHPERQKLTEIHIITDDTFNKSVTLNLESYLIKHMSADGKYKLQNGNNGLANYNYFLRKDYEDQFRLVWGRLHDIGLVKTDIQVLENKNSYKYSPYKTLTADQQEVMNKIIYYLYGYLKLNIEHTVLVSGSAGTGKTVMAVYLIKLLTDLSNSTYESDDAEEEKEKDPVKSLITPGKPFKIGFVVPMQSLRKTLKNVFKETPGLSEKMILNPNDVPKAAEDGPFDLLLCDEAHRLKRRWAMTGFETKRYDDNNKLLGLPKEATQLDWIIKCSHMQLLFYDPEQTIKPTDIPKEQFEQIINQQSKIMLHLTSQLRCLGGNDYINYVKNVLNGCQTDVIAHFPNYDIRFYDNVDEMVDRINELDADKDVGLCRTLAGYAWPWNTQNHPNDSTIIDIDIGRGYIWNRDDKDWMNSDRLPNEIGCIHTSQGYDLNYVGVIFGPEIIYDQGQQRIDVIRDNYKDDKGKYVSGDHEALRNFIINIYATLMLRGIRGTYLYICDPALREYMRKYFG